MGKRLIAVLVALLTMLCLTALAEDDWRVAEGLPVLDITWSDTGESTGDDRRPYLLAADVRAADGSFSQVVRWFSAEADDRIAPHVRLVDYNFDGYKDLQLLTAQGARNVYYTVALWDEERGCFRDVVQHVLYQPGGAFVDELVQAEFCNPEFYPDTSNPHSGYILSVEADGFYYRTERVYGWVGHDSLENYKVAAVYDAGEGLIGESLDHWGTGLDRCWDQVYPEDWYYGEGNADQKRTEARRLLMLDRGTVDPYFMQICNVSWVNLRQLDSKDSPSLAQLPRGTTVQVLATGCGEDEGWVLVLVSGNEVGLKTNADSFNDREVDGMTGYIWHSYLEPTLMYVANVDWANVREKPDKQSAVVTTATEGTRVHRRPADERDGWIPVSGWDENFTGWIWHSYLEPEEFVPYQ